MSAMNDLDPRLRQLAERALAEIPVPPLRAARRERRGPLASTAVAAAVLLVLVAALGAGRLVNEVRGAAGSHASPPVRPTVTAGHAIAPLPNEHRNTRFGYSLLIPAWFRHSEAEAGYPAQPGLRGVEIFTARTASEERTFAGGRFLPWDLIVEVWDRGGMSAEQWARTWYGCADGCTVSQTILRGLPTVRAARDAPPAGRIYLVERGDLLVVLRYGLGEESTRPADVSEAILDQIVRSVGWTAPDADARDAVIARVRGLSGEVLRVDRIEAKRVRWSDFEAAARTGSVQADDREVWIVAVAGEVRPQFARGQTFPWGIYVIDTKSDDVLGMTAGDGTWPPYFDGLRDLAAASPSASPPRVITEAEAWEFLRGALPAGTPLAVPTWLPSTIDRDHVEVSGVAGGSSDPRFVLTYRAASGTIVLRLGPADDVIGSGYGTRVRGQPATLTFASSLFTDPHTPAPRRVLWHEGAHTLSISSETFTGDDLLHIAWSLDPSGAPAPRYAFTRAAEGACAKPGASAADTVRAFVGLFGSGRGDAVLDCLTDGYVGSAGPALGQLYASLPAATLDQVTAAGTVGGRQVVRASWTFASDPGGAWGPRPTRFFSLALGAGRWRISDQATAPLGPPP